MIMIVQECHTKDEVNEIVIVNIDVKVLFCVFFTYFFVVFLNKLLFYWIWEVEAVILDAFPFDPETIIGFWIEFT